ncbi:MAG TPA: ABC transporter permease [Microthrixaceae bacterium]|nr:ABC transporter permease [Microthrixaceae bacterium]
MTVDERPNSELGSVANSQAVAGDRRGEKETVEAEADTEVDGVGGTTSSRQNLKGLLSPRKIGAIYLWAAIIVLFGILKPDLFLTVDTLKAIGNSYSIAGLAALAVLLPLVTASFDVSVGATMSLAGVVVGKLLLETSLPITVVVLIGLGVGLLVGLANTIVVVVLRIPSLIGTLAVSGVVGAFAVGVSGNQTLAGPRLSAEFSQQLAQAKILGFTRPVLFVLVLMVVLGLLLEQTQLGRYLYAVGFNANAAHLAGLRVAALKCFSLMMGGMIGAFAGIVLVARLASATPATGTPYLLPAFAAAFLGATQFRNLRFNAWGAVVAVFMLGTGQYGLLLLGAPSWTADVFQGLALIFAVGLTHFGSRQSGISTESAEIS